MAPLAFWRLPVLNGPIVPCSRTSSEDWECGQPSVPGYLRCEHHMWQSEGHFRARDQDEERRLAHDAYEEEREANRKRIRSEAICE
eukprot:CAMPEP_0184673458 /NCGR_PEP_ID=MMETSP0308-20130426/86691_1 /TAXON_ID=38269 /ORGANISM="Gloeochaete witrockiana, Strain SAG 46.84" /LENGTH=85 /DNA_ID=CAMNT_0027120945 /DNA_START=1162 /DNA_END=1419 /DNA_ORIENTATION=+